MKTIEDFDEKFNRSEDISDYVDYTKGRRPNLEQKRGNLNLPIWMIERLDKEARRLGLPGRRWW